MLPHGPRGPLPGAGRGDLAPCAAGCTRPGRHRPGCPDPGCPGCLPRAAERGVLCGACHDRLVHALRDLPRAVLRACHDPGPRAHALYDALAVWVRDALELYPAPTARPSRLDIAVPAPPAGPLTSWHRPLGVPDDVYGLADAAHALCGWLDRHLPWVEAQPWASRMVDELARLVDPARRG